MSHKVRLEPDTKGIGPVPHCAWNDGHEGPCEPRWGKAPTDSSRVPDKFIIADDGVHPDHAVIPWWGDD